MRKVDFLIKAINVKKNTRELKSKVVELCLEQS